MVCGLPGNPVSAVLTMYVLVQPMLAKLAGHSAWQAPESIPAITRSPFKKHRDGQISNAAFTALKMVNSWWKAQMTKLWRVPLNELG